ncbi:MAG: hypothetical protein HRT61_14480, partial [Ekhidna sp.]|nr:hypothetical protein [Ekhidna sp.]
MSQRFSFILLLGCFGALLINHVVIDWKGYEFRKAQESLDYILNEQLADLQSWTQDENVNPLFRKRTLCFGRLSEWSDNRPFTSTLSQDSIQIVSNDQGIFLIQKLLVDDCMFVSSHQLLEQYDISNQYLKSRLSTFLYEGIEGLNVSTSGEFDSISFDVRGMPSEIIDSLVTIIILFVLLMQYWRYSSISTQTYIFGSLIMVVLRLLTLYFD